VTIVLGMPPAEYHARPEVSKSRLDLLNRSPLHFISAPPVVETAAMRIGTALHVAVLEPNDWSTLYACAPDVDRRTKEGKAAYAAALEAVGGGTLLPADDYAAVLGMAEAVSRSSVASKLLARSLDCEVSVFWTDEETGIECRARPDALADDRSFVIDLKTTDDASPGAFERSIAKWGYHRQAAFYLDGVAAATGKRPEAFVFVVVERNAPHAVASYALTDDALEQGRRENRRLLALLKECRELGKWPGYPDSIQMISLPAWAKKGEVDYV
jgi:hypothetical protein